MTSKPLKRIPKNPRYEGVKPKVDSGASIRKYNEHMEYLRTNYRFKSGEIFKRIKATTFATLVLEVADAELDAEAEYLDDAAAFGGYDEDYLSDGQQGAFDDSASVATNMTSASSFASFVGGVGEREGGLQRPPQRQKHYSSPYLLLDLRDADEFAECHISGATNFPVARLSRASNSFTADMMAYINKPGRIIVLYDDDERIGTKAAEVFVQRGVDNVFLLSGGMKILAKKFPDGFLSAPLPKRLREKTKGKRSAKSSISSADSSLNSTMRSDMTVGGDGAGLPLTMDNLEKIRQQLETNLDLEDSASSTMRSTARSTTRSKMGATNRTTMSTTSSKPWK